MAPRTRKCSSCGQKVDRRVPCPCTIDTAAADLRALGGYLQCENCKVTRVLGDVGSHLRDGWPKCCNRTMRWVTDER